MNDAGSTILFAGGGTGGHLFPSIAIAERLAEGADAVGAPTPGVHFACSERDVDRRILTEAGVAFTPLPVRPLPSMKKPWQALPFVRAYARAKRRALGLIRERNVRLIVSTGGFVSAPPVAVAKRAGVPVMLVNLDAVPGKANRWLIPKATEHYSVYPSDKMPRGTTTVALPVRRSCIGPDNPRQAREAIGLDPDLPTLFVTGASQGAESINKAMVELCGRDAFRHAIRGWQVLHLAGTDEQARPLREAYERVGVPATVLDFCHTMGMAWGSADVAISRAGAGSVAEVAVNAVPSIFLPYPFHRDQHQKLNAQPLVDLGAAIMLEDAVDPAKNVERMIAPLGALLADDAKRGAMRDTLRQREAGDGAMVLAERAIELLAAPATTR